MNNAEPKLITKLELTTKWIESPKCHCPAGKDCQDYIDTKADRLYLRVFDNAKRTRTFTFVYSFGGDRARVTLGTFPAMSLVEARKLTEKYNGFLQEVPPRDPRVARKQAVAEAAKPKNSLTIAQVITLRFEREILHSAANHLRSWYEISHRYEKHVEEAQPLDKNGKPIEGSLKFGDILLKDFGPSDLLAIIQPIIDRGQWGAAKAVFFDMQALMRFAIAQTLLSTNPIRDIAEPEEPEHSDVDDDEDADPFAERGLRALSPDEVFHIWHELPKLTDSKQVVNIVRLCLATGLRVGEVAGIEASELHLKAEHPHIVISKRRVKNKKGAFKTYLNRVALDVIRDAQSGRKGSKFLFESKSKKAFKAMPVSGITATIKRLQAKVGLPTWRSHDLRRTVSTLARAPKNGLVDTRTYIDYVLNHYAATHKTVGDKHYDANDYFDEKVAALTQWGDFLQRIIDGKPGNEAVVAAASHSLRLGGGYRYTGAAVTGYAVSMVSFDACVVTVAAANVIDLQSVSRGVRFVRKAA